MYFFHGQDAKQEPFFFLRRRAQQKKHRATVQGRCDEQALREASSSGEWFVLRTTLMLKGISVFSMLACMVDQILKDQAHHNLRHYATPYDNLHTE